MEIKFFVLNVISMLMVAKKKGVCVCVWNREGVDSGRRSKTQRSVG